MKHYGKFIMLAGLCLTAYRRGGGFGLFLFGAAYTFADRVLAEAYRVIEKRREREMVESSMRVVDTEHEDDSRIEDIDAGRVQPS